MRHRGKPVAARDGNHTHEEFWEPAYELVEKIGKRFNEELAGGRHQEHFTEYVQ